MESVVDTKKENPVFLDRSQWMIAIGVFMPLYVELSLVLIVAIRIIKLYGRVLTSSIIKYMLIVFTVSFVTSSLIGYNQTKMAQQMIALTLFLLLYEQIFFRIGYDLKNLFVKYIKVCYYVCLLGIFQEVIFLLFNINVLSYLPGYFASQLITDGILRITSTCSEGGWLGTSLIPTIIYLFYYNDPFYVLNKKKKYLILLASLFTMSPFVYGAYFFIALAKINNRFKYARRILCIITACFAFYVFYNVISANNHEERDGINSIFIRIGDTYNVISNMNEEDLSSILRYSGNASSSVIATNMYIGLHAPSRLFGTGIGTNSQSYYNLVDVKTSFEYNPDDGYSLFNRILSEFGIVGMCLYLFFIFKFFNKKNILNICFLCMMGCLFCRGGNYMLYGTIFIHFFYYYTSKFELSDNQ